ncbi:MAG TPA: LCP family protein, partial [Candidatus Dorea intestinavium]|nr:LCP family protein [Candidatus Dorea intestinavium]
MATRKYRRGRRRNKKSPGASVKIVGLILGAIILMGLLVGVAYAASQFSKIDRQKVDTESLNLKQESSEKETGFLNVALFGLDSREGTLGKGNRSDAIMIASLNKETGEVKLVSIYRDTLLETSDNEFNKANAAYSFGGPEAAIAMINKNLDMNIEKYVTVNFNALVEVIDALGGMDLELDAVEVGHMNNYCIETAEVTGKEVPHIQPTSDGPVKYHLNGVQAVSYSRIRYTAGGDFKRSERQRLVLEKIAEKASKANIGALNKIVNVVFPQVSTNFTLAEMLGYAKDVKDYKMSETMGFPTQNHFDNISGVGSVVIADTLESNVLEVHKFLFGEDGYTVSDTIRNIQSKITVGDSSNVGQTEYEDDDTQEDVWYGIEEPKTESGYDNNASSIEDNSQNTT